MLFDNPLFENWYTDSMTIYRNVDVTHGNVDKKERKLMAERIPCRIYSKQKGGPKMCQTAAVSESVDKLACDLTVDIRACDPWRYVGNAWGAGTLFCRPAPSLL